MNKKQLSVLFVVSVTSFMGTFLLSSVNIALPAIERSFGLDAIALSWIISSFLLATAIFLLPVGSLGDISGNAKFFKLGLLIFSLASLFCALATTGEWLIVARFLQGVGVAFSITTGQAILVDAFLLKDRGRVIGLSVAAVYAGLACGPFLGGILTQYLGWRSLFYLVAFLAVVCTVLSFLFLEKDSNSSNKKPKFDFRGAVVFVFGLTALVCGASITPGYWGWLLMILGVVFLFLFWIIESRTADPMLDTKLYTANKLFAYSNIAALLNYTATFAIIFFLSFYLQKIKGLSPQQAGAIIIVEPIVMAIFSPIVGRLSDKIEPRYFVTIGMLMCALGLFALSLLGVQSPIWLIVLILFWEGFGFALFSSPNMSSIMSSVDKTKYGVASGSAASMRLIGQIFGMTIISLLFSYSFKGESIGGVADDVFISAMKWGFFSFAIICLPGVYFSVARGNLKRD